MNLRTAFVSLLVCATVSPVVFAQKTPRPVTIEDDFRIRSVSDPQISADGQWVTYTVGSVDLEEDKGKNRVWMVPAAGGDAIPLTAESASSSHARWSPDGKWIAFLSARDSDKSDDTKTQVWLLNRQGGEAEQLTSTPQDVEDFAWSPDGRELVLADSAAATLTIWQVISSR